LSLKSPKPKSSIVSKNGTPNHKSENPYLKLELELTGKKMNRPTSFAYSSVSPASSFWSKLMFYIRVNSKAVIATLSFFGVVLLMQDVVRPASPSMLRRQGLRGSGPVYFGGAFHPGYFSVEDSVIDENTFRFAAVSDLDQLSRMTEERKPTFRSILLSGILQRDPSTSMYSINFEPTRQLISQHNEAGRGMELSELTLYQNRLLTFDDRTGTVFEILSKDRGTGSMVAPRLVITEGDGDTDKGMKWEWATVKGNELYMGSMGKEYTNPDGSVANTNNLWIVVVNPDGQVRRVNWVDQYNIVRAKLGASSPGYIINEAILWSEHLQKWLFLPRRVSSEMYDEEVDERRGSNKLALVDEDFTNVSVVDIKFDEHDPLRGFSSFAFVPGTKDHHVLAIRSVEEDCVGGIESVCKQTSYFSVFDVTTGDVYMHEVEIKLDQMVKFEGVEFVNIHTPEEGKIE